MYISIDAITYNAYIYTVHKMTNKNECHELLSNYSYDNKLNKNLLILDNKYRKNKVKNTFPSNDEILLLVYLSFYAKFNVIHKIELLNSQVSYYEKLNDEVMNNKQTEDEYIKIGMYIKDVNSITNFFELIEDVDDEEEIVPSFKYENGYKFIQIQV